MKLISVIVFYSDKIEEKSPKEEKCLEKRRPRKETKLGSRILQLKYELANFPLGREASLQQDQKAANPSKKYELDLVPSGPESETSGGLTSLEMDRILVSPPVKLKTECCQKYLKGKRCGRCPCFDLPYGPASLSS